MKKNIILIGFASSGKSVDGKRISVEKGMRFVDVDSVIEDLYEIENGERLKVREIFERLGAEGFKKIETAALRKLISDKTENTVISTGGGTAINPENHQLLKALGRVVYLTCDVDVVIDRMRKYKGFPKSMGGDEKGVRETFEKREPIYRAVADEILKI